VAVAAPNDSAKAAACKLRFAGSLRGFAAPADGYLNRRPSAPGRKRTHSSQHLMMS